MEFKESIIIDKSRELVAEMFQKIRYSKEFTPTLTEVKSIEGSIGESSSVSELFYGNQTINVQKERVIENSFPYSFIFEIMSELSTVRTSVLFLDLAEDRTELKMKIEYLNMKRLLSFGMKAQKKFIRQHILESLNKVKKISEQF